MIGKMRDSTTSLDISNRHWTDVQKEAVAYWTLYSLMKDRGIKIGSAFEVMAGCGFGTQALKSAYPHTNLRLNDLSDDCVRVLKVKYPFAHVTQEDANLMEVIVPYDLVTVDFNAFTMKRWEKWKEALIRSSRAGKYLVITDSACYGFHMGNLKAYRIDTPDQYYLTLGETLRPHIFKYLQAVVGFGHASLVLFGSKSAEEVSFQTVGETPNQRKHGFKLSKPLARKGLWA